MPKFEIPSNIEGSKLAPINQKEAENLSSEVEKTQDLSLEEQLNNLDKKTESNTQEASLLTDSSKETADKIKIIRKELGLSPSEEEVPSIVTGEKSLEEIQAQQDTIERQKKEIKEQQEKDQLIQKEKEKIIQERLNSLFEMLATLDSESLDIISVSGKTRSGENLRIEALGEVDPELAKTLIKIFKEGVKLLANNPDVLSQLLKEFDKSLTEEAKQRVEQNMKEEIQAEIKPEENETTPREESQETKTESTNMGGENTLDR